MDKEKMIQNIKAVWYLAHRAARSGYGYTWFTECHPEFYYVYQLARDLRR